MISIDVEGEKVQVKVTMSVPFWENRVFPFTFECASRAYAGFFGRALQDKLFKSIQEARQEAYEQGWNDAKKKRRKEDYFKGWL
jgi:hypothetical protein